jgi:uncharacterized DUF497 family protein
VFEWDEEKRQNNLRKHGLDFIDAKEIWLEAVIELPSPQGQYGEERIIAIGRLRNRCITVIYTWRGDNRRLISARKAGKNEQKRYYNEIG